MEPQHPVAGWYKDPADPSRFRYWDGAAWTPQVRVPEPPAPPAPAPVPAPEAGPAPAPVAPEPVPARSARALVPEEPRQRLLVVGAVVALAAIGALVAVTRGGGGGFDLATSYEACQDEVDEIPETEDIEYQDEGGVTVADLGEDVSLAFWADDPHEEPGQQRIDLLCVVDGGDGDVRRLYLRLDELIDESNSTPQFDSVGSSIG